MTDFDKEDLRELFTDSERMGTLELALIGWWLSSDYHNGADTSLINTAACVCPAIGATLDRKATDGFQAPVADDGGED